MQIQVHIEVRIPLKEIRSRTDSQVSYRKFLKLNQTLYYFGKTRFPLFIPYGQPQEMSVLMGETLQKYLINKPSLYVDKLRDCIYDKFEVYLHISSIESWLYKNNITKKKIKQMAYEKNQIQRDW